MEPRQLLAADLFVNAVALRPRIANAGDNLLVTVGYRNMGDQDAGAFGVEVRISPNNVFGDSDDIVLGSIDQTDGLTAGEETAETRTFVLPDTLEPGTYFIGANVDSAGAVDEDHEDNNIRMTDNPLLGILGGSETSEIEVTGHGVVIADGDTSPSGADDTMFGTHAVNGGSSTRVYTIFNRGQAALNIDNITISGPGAAHFKILSQSADSVDPGESATFTVQFDPRLAGLKNAVVTIASDDADEAQYNFAIRGRGRGLPAAPEISVTGDAAIVDGDLTANTQDGTHFGTTRVGRFIDQTFTITNTGGRELVFSSPFVRIQGLNARRFSVISMPSDTRLAEGESTTFTVRFRATTPGLKKATLQILTNDSNEGVFNFEIRGRGRP